MPGHIAWPHLAPLSLKLYSARSVMRLGMPLSVALRSARDERALAKVWALAKAHTPLPIEPGQAGAALDPASPPLEGLFGKVAGDLRGYLVVSRGAKPPSATEGALQRACDTKVCEECKGSGPEATHMCAWTDQSGALDESVVSDRGWCLAPATEIFDFCAEAAIRAYRACLGAQYEGPVLQFTTAYGASNAFLGLSLDGTTEDAGPPDALTSVREVCLAFMQEDFNPRDYLAIAYTLAHECVAHGHCAPALCGPNSLRSFTFHDGWMDRIALDVLSAEALGTGPPGSSSVVRQHAPGFLAEAGRIHERRQDHWSPGAPEPNADRAAGVQALAAFRCIVNLALADAGLAMEPAAEISHAASLAINANPGVSHKQRADFVERLLGWFGGEPGEAAAAALATKSGRAVIAAVRQYIDDGKAADLVHAVLSIPPEQGLLVV